MEQDEEGKALRDKGGVERTGLQEVIVDRKSNGFENNTKLERKRLILEINLFKWISMSVLVLNFYGTMKQERLWR